MGFAHTLQRWFAPDQRAVVFTALFVVVWSITWVDWSAWHKFWAPISWAVFTAPAIPLWYWWKRKFAQSSIIWQRAFYSIAIFPIWGWLTFSCHSLAWTTAGAIFARAGLATAFMVGFIWVVWYVDKRAREIQLARLDAHPETERAGPLHSMGSPLARNPLSYREWNPLDLQAWYYGNNRQKFHQSLSTVFVYIVIFGMVVTVLTRLSGCSEVYEMPAGGGEQKQLQQVVKVQKVIKKKFVINPLSSVLFNPPPIDEVKLQLNELTKHAYTVGYGQGKGAGFAGGTNRGKVRFIRLEYSGGDWDQDFGIGADLNMLIEYGVRTGHKVAEGTESRTISQLKNFPKGKSPPMVYITGQKNVGLNGREIEIIRNYLLDKHGMIFADNGGSRHWHGQFFNVMQKVLPEVRPVRVPLDHPVHRVPYSIPFLPYVAPHGGKEAWGWVVDGRLVAYYHPGDIGDAWSDGHAGVKAEIYELCYQLGVNIIFYAHAEYNKWLDASKKDEE